MTRIIPLALILFFCSQIVAFNQIDKLKNLGDNTWILVDNAGISLTGGYTAYSGGTYDCTHHQFLVFGGGHTDGYYNDVLALDVSSMKWKSMYPSDPQSAYTCSNVDSTKPGMLLSSGLPESRHTYDQIDYIDHLGKMIVWSGPVYSGLKGLDMWFCWRNYGPNMTPKDTWFYDWGTNKWEARNTSLQAQPSCEGGCGAYDPVGKLYYAVENGPGNWPRFWSYNPDTDKWKMLANYYDSASSVIKPISDCMLTVDRKRQRLWQWPNCYDIPTNKWLRFNAPGGPAAGDGLADAYDEANDVLISVRSSVYVYHIDENRWETLNPAGMPGGSGIYGRFFYNPVDSVCMLIGSWSPATTYAYRYKRGSGTAVQVRQPEKAAQTFAASPNPFTASTSIRIPMNDPHSRIVIYNMLGQQVREIPMEQGRMEYAWDGKDSENKALPGGVYVSRMNNSGKNISLKLFLNR